MIYTVGLLSAVQQSELLVQISTIFKTLMSERLRAGGEGADRE